MYTTDIVGWVYQVIRNIQYVYKYDVQKSGESIDYKMKIEMSGKSTNYKTKMKIRCRVSRQITR